MEEEHKLINESNKFMSEGKFYESVVDNMQVTVEFNIGRYTMKLDANSLEEAKDALSIIQMEGDNEFVVRGKPVSSDDMTAGFQKLIGDLGKLRRPQNQF